jgi:hypothetical protein
VILLMLHWISGQNKATYFISSCFFAEMTMFPALVNPDARSSFIQALFWPQWTCRDKGSRGLIFFIYFNFGSWGVSSLSPSNLCCNFPFGLKFPDCRGHAGKMGDKW